jgi:hypothetical protein
MCFSLYICASFFPFPSRSLFVSLKNWGKETGDVDVVSMSGLTGGSCSTQLSCQHPNTTVNSTACAFDIATYSSFAFFFSLLLHLYDALACWLLITTTTSSRLTLPPVCLWHLVFHHQLQLDTLPHIKKKKKKNSIFFFFSFCFFPKRDSLNSTL